MFARHDTLDSVTVSGLIQSSAGWLSRSFGTGPGTFERTIGEWMGMGASSKGTADRDLPQGVQAESLLDAVCELFRWK